MSIRDVIEERGYFATGGGDSYLTAETWAEAGFDWAEVEEWLKARCFDPGAARDLSDAGVTPEMASIRTDAGRGDYVDTVGFKVSDGDLEVEEARDLVGAS